MVFPFLKYSQAPALALKQLQLLRYMYLEYHQQEKLNKTAACNPLLSEGKASEFFPGNIPTCSIPLCLRQPREM